MNLVSSKELLQKAWQNHYAIGGFNINNMEIIQGIMAAADSQKSPVILQVSAGARKYAGRKYIIKLIEAAVLDYTHIPVVLHLDHGETFDICKDCIDDGFMSVMIDGSKYSFEENIALTKQVVDYAHPRGVQVEAELGRLAGVEDSIQVSSAESSYTDPVQAVEFVERTGCDSLAIAVGTSHGAYKFKEEPALDFDRLETITRQLPNYPLVLHGASSVLQEFVQIANQYGGQIQGALGVPEAMIKKASQLGVCKVNIDTDIRLAFTATIRKILSENPAEFDPRFYLKEGRKAVEDMVAHKINILGSSDKI